MRIRILALAALVAGLPLAAGAADPKVEYILFASSEGRYKVLFPGPVRTEKTDVKTATGPLKLTLDTVKLSDQVVYMVTYVDLPDDVAKTPTGPRLDKVRDGNKGGDGKVLTDQDVTIGAEKHPGRDVLIAKPTISLRNRIVIVGNRLYQVMLQGPHGFVTSRDADRFIESFEVTK
jgi:hypothetical protein